MFKLPRAGLCALLLVVLAVAHAPSPARAGDFADGVVSATKPLLAAGVAAALLSSKEDGGNRAARAADAIVLAGGISQLMKYNVDIRTDDSLRNNFPSAHTATAFAAASSLSHVYPENKLLLYAGAALIGWSTVAIDGHNWADVAAGAALGTALGNWSMTLPNGLMIGRAYRF